MTATAQSIPRSPRGGLQTHQDSLGSVAGALSSLGSAAHLPGTARSPAQSNQDRPDTGSPSQAQGLNPSSQLAWHSTVPHRKACGSHKAPALSLQSCNLLLPGADNMVYPTIAPVPVAHIDPQAAPVSRGQFWDITAGTKPC